MSVNRGFACDALRLRVKAKIWSVFNGVLFLRGQPSDLKIINVQVTGKNVELSGTVPSKDAKDKAEQIARSHAGGLGVKNHLKVGGS